MLSHSAPKSKPSFWSRRRTVVSDKPTVADISAPVLISRSDRGRKCVPLECARKSLSDTSVSASSPASVSSSQPFSPLRMNPVTSSARESTVSSVSSDFSAAQSSRSAPAVMTRRGAISDASPTSAVVSEQLATFAFPSPPPSAVSQLSSAVSSRFSVWSTDSSDDEVDECASELGDEPECEPVFENVTPVSPRLSVADFGAEECNDMFTLSLNVRQELSKAVTAAAASSEDNATLRHRRARMAIYIPSTSSESEGAESNGVTPVGSRKPTPASLTIQVPPAFRKQSVLIHSAFSDSDDETIQDEVAQGHIFYPAIPELHSACSSARPASEIRSRRFADSFYSVSGLSALSAPAAFHCDVASPEEQEIDDLLAAYQ